jgi:hypothetical protein
MSIVAGRKKVVLGAVSKNPFSPGRMRVERIPFGRLIVPTFVLISRDRHDRQGKKVQNRAQSDTVKK